MQIPNDKLQMQTIQLQQKSISIYQSTFLLQLQTANINIKFPCHYFVEWKSLNGKVLAETQKHPSNNHTEIQFNQSIEITTEMLYDQVENKYYKKETLLAVNLVSKSRPDQVKLVGRVTINLADIMNHTPSIYSQPAPYKLTYCSVNADITFTVKLTHNILTNKQPQHLNKSSFNDFFVWSNSNQMSQDHNQKSRKLSKSPSNVLILPRSGSKQSTHQIQQNKSTVSQSDTRELMRKESLKKLQTKDGPINQRPSPKNLSIQETKTIRGFLSMSPKNDQSFRTLPARKQTVSRSPEFNDNDSMTLQIKQGDNGIRNMREQRFSEEIDYNKRKIAELEKKVSQLCKNLQQSDKKVGVGQERSNVLKQEIQGKGPRVRVPLVIEAVEQVPSHQQSQDNHPSSPRSSLQHHIQKQKISSQYSRLYEQSQSMFYQSQLKRQQLEKLMRQRQRQWENKQGMWKIDRQMFEDRIRRMEKENKQVNREIDLLGRSRQQMEKIMKERDQMKEEYKQLQHELMKTRFELGQKEQKNTQTSDKLQLTIIQMQKTNQEIHKLRQSLTLSQEELTSLKTTHEKLMSSYGQLSLTNQQLLVQSDKLNSLLQFKEEQVNKLQTQIRDRERQFVQIKQDYDIISEEIVRFKDKLQECHQYIEHLTLRLKDSENRVEQLTQRVRECQEKMKQKQAKLNQTHQTISHHQQAITELNRFITRTEKQLKDKDVQLDSLRSSIEEKEQQLLQLSQQIEQVNKEKQLLMTRRNGSVQIQIQGLKEQFELKQRQMLSQHQVQLHTLQSRLTLLEQQLHHALQHCQHLTQELKESQTYQKQLTTIFQQKLAQQRTLFQQQLQSLTQQRQQAISQLQNTILGLEIQTEQLNNKLTAQQSSIHQNQLQLQRRKTIIEQLTQKLNLMQTKQHSMLQTINDLQKQAQNILLILQQKHSLQQFIQRMKLAQNKHLTLIEEQHHIIASLKLQKDQVIHKFQEQIQCGQAITQLLKHKDEVIQHQRQQNTQLRKKLQQTDTMINQMNERIIELIKDNTRGNNIIKELEEKNQGFQSHCESLEQELFILQSLLNDKEKQIAKNCHLQNANLQFDRKLQQKQKQLYELSQKLMLIETNSHKNQGQSLRINPYSSSNVYSNKVQILKSEVKVGQQTEKHSLHQQLPIQSNQHYVLSERQLDNQEKSHSSMNEYEQVHIPGSEITQDNHAYLQLYSHQINPQRHLNNDTQHVAHLLEVIEEKDRVIEQLEMSQRQLLQRMKQLEQQIVLNAPQLAQQQTKPLAGRINPNSPRMTNHLQSHNIDIPSWDNNEQSAKHLQQTISRQQHQITQLSKQLNRVNLQLATLRTLKKEQTLLQTEITPIHQQFITQISLHEISHPHLNHSLSINQRSNNHSPAERSYLIRKVDNNVDTSKSIKQNDSGRQRELIQAVRENINKSASRQIVSNRQFLQRKLNIHSRMAHNTDTEVIYANKPEELNLIEQRILSRLQHSAINMSSLEDVQLPHEVTTTTQLRQRISHLQQALQVIQQQKAFLQNQFQIMQDEKFCLSSDLNQRQIQIYELYKSMLAIREEMRLQKLRKQSYLRIIQSNQQPEESISERYQINQQSSIMTHRDQNQYNILDSQSLSHIKHVRQQQNNDHSQTLAADQLAENMTLFQHDKSLLSRISHYQYRLQSCLVENKLSGIQFIGEKKLLQDQLEQKLQKLVQENDQLYSQSQEITQLNNKIYQLQQQLAQLHSLMQDNQKQHHQKQQINHSINNDHPISLIMYQNQSQIMYKNQSLIMYENESLNKENTSLKQQLNYLNEQIKRANEQHNQLNLLLKQRMEQIHQLQRQITLIKQDWHQVQNNLLEEINLIQSQLINKNQLINHLEHQLSDHYQRYNFINSQLLIVLTQLNRLQQQMSLSIIGQSQKSNTTHEIQCIQDKINHIIAIPSQDNLPTLIPSQQNPQTNQII